MTYDIYYKNNICVVRYYKNIYIYLILCFKSNGGEV